MREECPFCRSPVDAEYNEDGTPTFTPAPHYDFGHAIRVASAVPLPFRELAVLHDVLEDTDVTAEQLREWGMYPSQVEILDALTRREGEAYEEYIQRVAVNPRAALIKLADLADNLGRMDAEHESLRGRYEDARRYLACAVSLSA